MKMDRSTFRIAHVSDLHLTAREGAWRSEAKLFRPLTGMNEAFRRVVKSRSLRASDLIVVTGDVTDRGDLDSWKVFWEAVDGAGLKEKCLIVPGNHDVCCLGLRLPKTGKGYRRKDLEKAKRGLRLGGQQVDFPWAFPVDGRLVLFGINSNNLGNLSALENAMGDIAYNQLASLARLMKRHRDVPVKLVLLHHSPNIPGRSASLKRGIAPMGAVSTLAHRIPRDQRVALRLLCITHGVRLIMHGHLHRAEDRRVDGVRIVGAPATTEPVSVRKHDSDYLFTSYTLRGDAGPISGKRHIVSF